MAGGLGSRLWPMTESFSKHLLPVYDKPMIYYSLTNLMLVGIREILIITTDRDYPLYQKLLGNGAKFGILIEYRIQEEPKGIPDGLQFALDWQTFDKVTLALGDNLFFGHDLPRLLSPSDYGKGFAEVYAIKVKEPSSFGVIEFDKNFNVLSLEEKPKLPKSSYIVPGWYHYDNEVAKHLTMLKPSQRGEVEITDLHNKYLGQKKLKVRVLGRGFSWFDTGTPSSLLHASILIEGIQKNQNQLVCSPHEAAINAGLIKQEHLDQKQLLKTQYGRLLLDTLKQTKFVAK